MSPNEQPASPALTREKILAALGALSDELAESLFEEGVK
jgi:hypothetical protein